MIRAHVGNAPKLRATPGTKSAFSNLGYLLLGQLIERVAMQRFERYLEEHVLAPLGCETSGFTVSPEQATGYQKKWSAMGLAARWLLDARFFGETSRDSWCADARPSADELRRS